MERRLDRSLIALSKETDTREGRVRFHANAIDKHRREWAQRSPGDRKKIATELLALATKLRRTRPRETEPAVAQLCELAAGLLGELAQASDIFDRRTERASLPRASAVVLPKVSARAINFGPPRRLRA